MIVVVGMAAGFVPTEGMCDLRDDLMIGVVVSGGVEDVAGEVAGIEVVVVVVVVDVDEKVVGIIFVVTRCEGGVDSVGVFIVVVEAVIAVVVFDVKVVDVEVGIEVVVRVGGDVVLFMVEAG